MKLFDTLKNIWKIEELKTRILTTLGLILVYRLGTEVVLPGIDPAGLAALKQQTSSGVLGLLDMFSGGAFSNASIFALGIMPYISASIVIQLLGIVSWLRALCSFCGWVKKLQIKVLETVFLSLS